MKKWLIEGLIPENHTILLLGQPHGGKSWFALSLAISIASGTQFLGKFQSKQGSVIVIDEDTPTDTLQERGERLAKGIGKSLEELPIKLRSMEGFQLDTSSDVDEIVGEIQSSGDTVLLVLDSLSSMEGRWDENRTGDSRKIGDEWKKFKNAGATVMVVHHMSLKKDFSYEDADFAKCGMGNTHIVSQSDTMFGIWNVESNGRTIFVVRPQSRRASLEINEPFAIELDEGSDGGAKLVILPEIPKVPSEDAAFIAPIFVQDGENFDFKKIKAEIKEALPDTKIRAALKELEIEKVIVRGTERHNRYVYSLNPEFNSLFGSKSSYIQELKKCLSIHK